MASSSDLLGADFSHAHNKSQRARLDVVLRCDSRSVSLIARVCLALQRCRAGLTARMRKLGCRVPRARAEMEMLCSECGNARTSAVTSEHARVRSEAFSFID